MAERTTTETIILTKKYIADMGLSLALSKVTWDESIAIHYKPCQNEVETCD